MNKHHILVVDDDTRLRQLLKQYLEGRGFQVSTAKNTESARSLITQHMFDAMIVDVMMPGEDGVTFTKRLRDDVNTRTLPILMLTAMGEASDRISGLESGADDYLTKPFEPKELCLRLENLIRRNIPQTERNITTFGDFRFDTTNGSLHKNELFVPLTSTELKLLTLLAKSVNHTVMREDLSTALNGISERSIDVQITRLRKKLEEDPKNPYYLETVRGQGYVLWSRK